MTSIETNFVLYRAETYIVTDIWVFNSWQHGNGADGFRINLWRRRINTSVEPARGHNGTFFCDTAKRRNVYRLRHRCSVDRQPSMQDTVIAVTFCVICDILLFWDLFIVSGFSCNLFGKYVGRDVKLRERIYSIFYSSRFNDTSIWAYTLSSNIHLA